MPILPTPGIPVGNMGILERFPTFFWKTVPPKNWWQVQLLQGQAGLQTHTRWHHSLQFFGEIWVVPILPTCPYYPHLPYMFMVLFGYIKAYTFYKKKSHVHVYKYYSIMCKHFLNSNENTLKTENETSKWTYSLNWSRHLIAVISHHFVKLFLHLNYDVIMTQTGGA